MNSVCQQPPTAQDKLQVFPSLSLSELDARAGLMDRVDHKYVASREHILAAFADHASHFRILEIAGKRSFVYENHYFDTQDHVSFHKHRQGKRKRFKVRTRLYADSGTCFLEVKLKGVRDSTIKTRIPHDPEKSDQLDDAAIDFIRTTYRQAYGKIFLFELQPSLTTRYQRTTLVANNGTERITIDSQLEFGDESDKRELDRDVAIVETKANRRNGRADKIIRSQLLHPLSSCSKYCVGMALVGKVDRYNPFLPSLHKLTMSKPALEHDLHAGQDYRAGAGRGSVVIPWHYLNQN